ncbi:TIGR03752 family integrating conjugative element protein [Janthinobacterium sp. BJB446]|uniref:TIGR03752 family integrating conjugative element protein n=1 Tax=Janthinobacterium sp. BJB446 TaxID=2048009 RepID=UPI000C0C650D|nr:TIGR03752 family integrating conjugative element protein [Janthinobacterium sp. BJB446]PHV19194.1 TIGR03752 family integrating conjugative element protein [Janthinobacterium sp. BJB446]
MPAITQSKLTPIFTICAVLIVAYVLFARYGGGQSAAVKVADPLPAVPVAPGDEAPASSGGLFGVGALSPAPRRADADSPSETLKTVTASNNELRDKVQKVIEANDLLKQENARLQNNQATIVAEVTERVLAEQRLHAKPAPEAGDSEQPGQSKPGKQSPTAIGGIVDAATGGYSTMVNSLGSTNPKGIPTGLGYDDSRTTDVSSASNGRASATYTRHLPVGYKEAKAGDGTVAIMDSMGRPVRQGAPTQTTIDPVAGTARAASRNQDKHTSRPFYTIPENATMTKVTLMTALVGRVPIDGKVHDPMQFKLLIGRDNLAANGHRVPDAVAGIVMSGIAIGDMALSCSEGLIQSLTFVFDDGTIKTVSMKRDGATPTLGGTGGGQATQSVTQSNKLAWISDEYGNPCVSGKFVTNAPSYLADMVTMKTLSIAAQATALAETTTAENAFGSTTAVTGNKGTYVLGQAAGSGVNEVSNWIMRRLNNSFDAVVTPAGGRLVVHFEQEIAIDKASDGRKLDFGNSEAPAGARQLLD